MSKLETKIRFVGGGAMAQPIAEGLVFISVKPHLYLIMLDTLKKEGRKYEDKLWVSISTWKQVGSDD